MDHAWLYKHLPEAEKRQPLPEADHTFSQSFERRMQGLFHPDPIKRMVSFGQKAAAVLLAAVCVSGILLCEPVRGWVGEVFVRETPIWTYLHISSASYESFRELPDELLGYQKLFYGNSIQRDVIITHYGFDGETHFTVGQYQSVGEVLSALAANSGCQAHYRFQIL